jgi:hypothetical protein
VERGMGGSQPGEGGQAHPQSTYISPKLFLLLACLTLWKICALLAIITVTKDYQISISILQSLYIHSYIQMPAG